MMSLPKGRSRNGWQRLRNETTSAKDERLRNPWKQRRDNPWTLQKERIKRQALTCASRIPDAKSNMTQDHRDATAPFGSYRRRLTKTLHFLFFRTFHLIRTLEKDNIKQLLTLNNRVNSINNETML